MFTGKVTSREFNKIQKIEVKGEDVFQLLELISKFDDLDIIEVHITKGGV